MRAREGIFQWLHNYRAVSVIFAALVSLALSLPGVNIYRPAGHSERAIIWNSTLGHGRNLSLKKYLAVDLRVPLLPRMHNEGINQVSIHYPQS